MSTRTTLTPEQANRRRNLNKKILTFGCLPITVILILVIVAAIAGSGQEDTMDAAPTQSPVSKADRDKAREAAGLPPGPDKATTEAYLKALNAIDPRIAKPGKDDQTVSRGLNQCSSIKTHQGDRAKLIELTLDRFTITTRFPEIATPETGGKVLDVVHKHLCPDF